MTAQHHKEPEASDHLEAQVREEQSDYVGELYDLEVAELVAKHPSAAVAWMLIASYAYYIHNNELITDATFDYLRKVVQENFDTITHPHLHLVHENGIVHKSLFELSRKDYPERVKNSWRRLSFYPKEFSGFPVVAAAPTPTFDTTPSIFRKI